MRPGGDKPRPYGNLVGTALVAARGAATRT